MPPCLFVTDLHGHPGRYRTLFRLIESEMPAAVFIGGDLLPSGHIREDFTAELPSDFIGQFLVNELQILQRRLEERYPTVALIMGNDDPRSEESKIKAATNEGLWHYVHNEHFSWQEYQIFGYAYVPPTPFLLKDWERYDVSRYVDPGCISPEAGKYTVPVPSTEKRFATIKKDLETLTEQHDLSRAIFLFHSPPYQTGLDRAALDERTVEHVPVDVNVGSIAIREFIAKRQPLITLHGHIHEAVRLSGFWRTSIGKTHLFSAAHDGPELAVVRFDPAQRDGATRELL